MFLFNRTDDDDIKSFGAKIVFKVGKTSRIQTWRRGRLQGFDEKPERLADEARRRRWSRARSSDLGRQVPQHFAWISILLKLLQTDRVILILHVNIELFIAINEWLFTERDH